MMRVASYLVARCSDSRGIAEVPPAPASHLGTLSQPDAVGNRRRVIRIASVPANWFAPRGESKMDAKAPAAVTTFGHEIDARGHHKAMAAALLSTRCFGFAAVCPSPLTSINKT